MKTLIFIILSVFTLSGIQAQEKTKDKITETTIEVPGVCKMCKARIEEAALRTKGVKLAEWDKNTKLLKLIYRNDKVTKEEINQSVASIGHGYNLTGADSTAYESLPDCCKYNDGVSDH